MAVIDSIVSMPAALLPWKEMVAICHVFRKDDCEVWSIIDAAHSLGQEQNINLSEAKPDFWISVRVLTTDNGHELVLISGVYRRMRTSGCTRSEVAPCSMFHIGTLIGYVPSLLSY